MPSTEDTDFLHGAAAIGAFLGVSTRRATYLCEKGLIPAGKIGGMWSGRKSRIREHYRQIEDAAVASSTEAA